MLNLSIDDYIYLAGTTAYDDNLKVGDFFKLGDNQLSIIAKIDDSKQNGKDEWLKLGLQGYVAIVQKPKFFAGFKPVPENNKIDNILIIFQGSRWITEISDQTKKDWLDNDLPMGANIILSQLKNQFNIKFGKQNVFISQQQQAGADAAQFYAGMYPNAVISMVGNSLAATTAMIAAAQLPNKRIHFVLGTSGPNVSDILPIEIQKTTALLSTQRKLLMIYDPQDPIGSLGRSNHEKDIGGLAITSSKLSPRDGFLSYKNHHMMRGTVEKINFKMPIDHPTIIDKLRNLSRSFLPTTKTDR